MPTTVPPHAFGADFEDPVPPPASAVRLDVEDHEFRVAEVLGAVPPRGQLPLPPGGLPQAVVLEQERLERASRHGRGLGFDVQHRPSQMLQRQRAVGFGELADGGLDERAAPRTCRSVRHGHAA